MILTHSECQEVERETEKFTITTITVILMLKYFQFYRRWRPASRCKLPPAVTKRQRISTFHLHEIFKYHDYRQYCYIATQN